MLPRAASHTSTPWTDNAQTVLARRYLLRDADGRVVEAADALLRRVARAVASAEARHGGDASAWEAKFYDAMARLEFLPNSPTLMNAGNISSPVSARFVLPGGHPN